MQVSTIEESVDALLRRRVAESKHGGAPRPDLESAAIFHSIALNMLLKPRSVIYFMFLARNKLIKSAQAELNAIADLRTVVDDLGNISYKIFGLAALIQAKNALLNIEGLPGLSANSLALDRYRAAVNEFLDKHLAPNVRRVGASDLTRPSAEALVVLPSKFKELTTLHSDVLDRAASLAVGVDNFESAPFSTLLGTTTVSRVRKDLEEIIAQVQESGDPAPSRDFAIRLLSSMATLDTLSVPPAWSDPILTDIPAHSNTTAPSALSTVSDGYYGTAPGESTIAISVTGLGSAAFSFFPEASCVLSSPTQLTDAFPANGRLFFSMNSDPNSESHVIHSIPLTGLKSSVVEVAADITTAGAAYGIQAVALGDRVLLYTSEASVMIHTDPGTTPSVDDPGWFEQPASDPPVMSFTDVSGLVGFSSGQKGIKDQLSAEDVSIALNTLFGDYITAEVVTDEIAIRRVQVVANSSEPGTEMTISGASGYGLDGTYTTSSNTIFLESESTTFVQPGDLAATSIGAEAPVVRALDSISILVDPIPTFTGSVSVTSSVADMYSIFIAELKDLLQSWPSSPYSQGLTVLNRALAVLLSSRDRAQRNAVLAELDNLETWITSLLNVLTNQSTMLPDGAGLQERAIVEGILATLEERGFTRAADLLLKGDVASMLEMTSETASYGGAMMAASSEVAASFDKSTTQESGRPDAVIAGGN